MEFFQKIKEKIIFSVKFSKNTKEKLKTQGKKPKLKEKTQALGVLILALAPN